MSTPMIFWDVDTQRDFMEGSGALYVPGAEEIVSNLYRLSDKARELSIPIVADADDHESWDLEISGEPDFQTTFPPHCMHGTPGADRIAATEQHWTLELGHERRYPVNIRRGLDTDWPRLLLRKKELDIFSNPNTDTVLDLLRPASIVVYGVALDYCVRQVVDGLLERGYGDLVIITDATKAIYPERADLLLGRWSAGGVLLETTESFLRGLERPVRRAVG